MSSKSSKLCQWGWFLAQSHSPEDYSALVALFTSPVKWDEMGGAAYRAFLGFLQG